MARNGGKMAKHKICVLFKFPDFRNQLTSVNLTYYFDHYNQIMFEGPRLNIARSYHGAGIVTDLITSEKFVVVTGGKYYDDDTGNQYFCSTEVLVDGKWVLGNYM